MLEKKISALKNMNNEELVREYEKMVWKLASVNPVSTKKQSKLKSSAA